MPLARADATISLVPVGSDATDVTIRMSYDTKYGPIGWLMDRMLMRNMMSRIFKEVLQGLDTHVTTGAYIGEKGPESARGTNPATA